mmetsp:Transcript_42261/g.101721  ORF Transcript_42261/g.101721 Transcript_42261/m.101721 type:complete len:849 (+) Transcript_42261:31-2577(+)
MASSKRVASSPSLSSSKSGLQKEVLSLYRTILRAAVRKDRSSSSCSSAVAEAEAITGTAAEPSTTTDDVSALLGDDSTTTHNARYEFRRQASAIPKKDFRTIEHYIRQGYKKIKTLQMTHNKGFVSVSGNRGGSDRGGGGGSANSGGGIKRRYHSAALTTNYSASIRNCRNPFGRWLSPSPPLLSNLPYHNTNLLSTRPSLGLIPLMMSSSFSTTGAASATSTSTSSSSLPLPRLKQGSTLSFRTDVSNQEGNVPPCQVTIQSHWRDDGEVSWTTTSTGDTGTRQIEVVVQDNDDDDDDDEGSNKDGIDTLMTSIGREEPLVPLKLKYGDTGASSSSSPVHVSFNVPEKVNLDIDLGGGENLSSLGGIGGGGSISIQGKIEGDIRLRTTNGNIVATKLRGHKIDIEITSQGTVFVSDVLESQDLNIKIPYPSSSSSSSSSSSNDNRVRVKRIHTNNMELSVVEGQTDSALVSGGDVDHVITDSDDSGAIVDISSLYVIGDGNVQVTTDNSHAPDDDDNCHRQAVRVKSHHGHINVETNIPSPTRRNEIADEDLPVVDLGGVNGSCEILISSSSSNTNLAPQQDLNDTKSCHVHFDSIVPDSVSLIQSEWGGVHVTADRKVEADIRLLSFGGSSDEEINNMVYVDTLILEDDDGGGNESSDDNSRSLADELVRMLQDIDEAATSISPSPSVQPSQKIQIETNAFTERQTSDLPSPSSPQRPPFQTIDFVDGWIENKSSEPDSRFDRKLRGIANTTSGGGVGKIRLDGAQEQALQSFDSSSSSKKESNNNNNNSSSSSSTFARPLLAVCTPGSIRLETLSWLGNIARRYGLDDKRDQDDLGRQATRRGRL